MKRRPLFLLVLLAFLTPTPAHAGPTVSTDLDLGTSTRSTTFNPYGSSPSPVPLYVAGFGLRAGWRFDVAPVWFLPEIGASYVVERFNVPSDPSTTIDLAPPSTSNLARLAGGGRIGWSGVLAPELHFEPSIYGHVGAGWYSGYYSQATAYACDVGLSLDLRIRRHFIVGAQVGYDVVTIPPTAVPKPLMAGTVPFTQPAVADPWVSYGIHAGWLFW